MRIKNLKIDSFGKLENIGITPDDKITVISGKNEAGKSTISSFVKYMLYGFDNSKKQNLSENQKKKYMPWSGEDVSGEMTIETSDGNEYIVIRHTGKRSTNTIVDKNDVPVTGDDAGQYFLGVNESTYKKTAFIGSSVSAFTDDGELSMAIRNMVYSADENQDSEKALKRLEELRKFYLGKAERSGKIFDLEKELCTLVEEREKWKDGHKTLLSAEYNLKKTSSKISENKEKLAKLNEEKQNLEYKKAKQKLESIFEAKKRVEKAENDFAKEYKLLQNGSFVPDNEYYEKIKNCLSELSDLKKAIEDRQTSYVRAKENLDRISSDKNLAGIFSKLEQKQITSLQLLEEISSLENQRKKAKKLAVILTALIVTIPVAIFFYVKSARLSKKLNDCAAEYGCDSINNLVNMLSGASSYIEAQSAAAKFVKDCEQSLEDKKNSLVQKKKELESVLNMANVSLGDVDEYMSRLRDWLSATSKLKQVCREMASAYNAVVSEVDVEALKNTADQYDEKKDVHDEKSLMQQIAFYTQSIEALLPKERELEKSAAVLSNTLPKPAEIQSRILSIEENLGEMRAKHKALVLAIDALEKASEGMKSEAAPKIASETSSLFGAITEGKYRALYADSDMNLSFLSKDDADVRDAGYLSTGTLDAAYISLRVALCKFLYKEKPTLVFDDAFSHMDNERLEKTLSFVEDLSKEFQIIILSCHDREKNYFAQKAKIIDFVVE